MYKTNLIVCHTLDRHRRMNNRIVCVCDVCVCIHIFRQKSSFWILVCWTVGRCMSWPRKRDSQTHIKTIRAKAKQMPWRDRKRNGLCDRAKQSQSLARSIEKEPNVAVYHTNTRTLYALNCCCRLSFLPPLLLLLLLSVCVCVSAMYFFFYFYYYYFNSLWPNGVVVRVARAWRPLYATFSV